ncbi:hypothetical protein Drose_16040 [Dactylosporangium roseum]|uniref:ABM domain-containing protein n=1 Tax=Dactylosporangium roseum TaxID=47989 RepID=A0ABY5ZF67_9ACTN|nr:hypothetical protein [Dactylosporangium roseum]UWZ39598.1 hypothetical protein Drose_16040 [Dactylosporangium roseum]
MVDTSVALPGAGSVTETYEHRPKLITTSDGLRVSGAHLKWYDIQLPDRPIDAEVRTEARDFLTTEASTPGNGLDLRDELGFAILHRCGETFHFLLISTWRGNNELWEAVYAKDGGPFAPFPQPTRHRGTFCVWELGAVLHEQQAWVRYLTSPRDQAARQAYVEDHFTGPVA